MAPLVGGQSAYNFVRYGHDSGRLPGDVGPACCLDCHRYVPRATIADPVVHLPPPDWCGWCGRAVSEAAREAEIAIGRPLETLMAYSEARAEPDKLTQSGAVRQRPRRASLDEKLETATARIARDGWGAP